MVATPAVAGTNNVNVYEEILMDMEMIKPGAVIASLLFALIGVAVFWLCFVIIDKITPYDLWTEIVEKQNKALALVVAAMCLGISIIVAAAIH